MKKIIILIMCLFPATLFAQSATHYFHTAANYYVNADKKNAQLTIREGINKYPDDQVLKKLSSKIDELPDPEDENKKQQNKQEQQQQDKDKQKQEKQQQQQQQSQMSKENAQQLLDAVMQDEQKTQEKAKQKELEQMKKYRAERDW